MTIQTASTKLIEATNKLNDARKAQSEMAVIVSAEQTGFERMVPLAAAVEQARRAEDWANTMLVKAITNR
jgi:hypothetical protein